MDELGFASLHDVATSIAADIILPDRGRVFDLSSDESDSTKDSFHGRIRRKHTDDNNVSAIRTFKTTIGGAISEIVGRAFSDYIDSPEHRNGSKNLSDWIKDNFSPNKSELSRVRSVFITPSLYTTTLKGREVNRGGGLKHLADSYIREGTVEGGRIAEKAMGLSGAGKDTLTEYSKYVHSAYTNILINWHMNSRFPFARSSNKDINGVSVVNEYNAGFGLPGEMPEISKDANRRVYPSPEADYPYDTYAPSPTLTDRVNRIADIACQEIKDRISVVVRKMSREIKYKDDEYGNIVPTTGLRESVIDGVLRDVALKVNGWANRLLISEKLRVMQMSQLYYYRAMGVKWYKWVNLSDHTKKLYSYGLFRDWCDDLAETPLEITVKAKADRNYLESIAYLIPANSYTKSTSVPVSRNNVVTTIVENSLLGIYPTTTVIRKMVPVLAHKWVIVKGHQHITGRVLRVVRIPPHPYCSCLMLPVFDPNNPKDSLRHDLSIISELANKVGEEKAISFGHSITKAMLSGAAYGDLYNLFLEFFAPETAKILATETQETGPDTLIMSPSEIGIREIRFAA